MKKTVFSKLSFWITSSVIMFTSCTNSLNNMSSPTTPQKPLNYVNYSVKHKNGFNTKSVSELVIPSFSTGLTSYLVNHNYAGWGFEFGNQGLSDVFSTLELGVESSSGRIFVKNTIIVNAVQNTFQIWFLLPRTITNLVTGDVIDITISPDNSLSSVTGNFPCQNTTNNNVFESHGYFIGYMGSTVIPLDGANFQLTVGNGSLTLKLMSPLINYNMYRADNCTMLSGNKMNIHTIETIFNSIPIGKTYEDTNPVIDGNTYYPYGKKSTYHTLSVTEPQNNCGK